jgi:hypothetical protein
MTMRTAALILNLVLATAGMADDVEQFAIKEWTFIGPAQSADDTPARDCTLTATLRHETGDEVVVHGFFDGDGEGSASGNVFKLRFCPTIAGTWTIVETASNHDQLRGQHAGESIHCTASDSPGLWIADGGWYRRSDGSHPMIVGNTHYTFFSLQSHDGPLRSDPASDIAAQAEIFNKVRFSLVGDRYPDPDLKPFLDDAGRQTDEGRYSYRPNPAWFHNRVDPAIAQGLASDVICDIITGGLDTFDSRSILKGDNLAWLRYVAARYGSYPNVWFCICNEWNIKDPSYTAGEMIAAGETLGQHLPHPTTPVSVHGDNGPWHDELNGEWCDHAIIQWKLKTIPEAADAAAGSQRLAEGRPLVNDENAYQGDGDGFSEEDTIEGCFGTFLGGGYPTTGEKYDNKLGQYFWGGFDAGEHSAADNLGLMRHYIDENVEFWKMAPLAGDEAPFADLPEGFRVLGNSGSEYVLGSNSAARITCDLPPGQWRITQVDLIAGETAVVAESAAGEFEWTTPGSRAVLTHLRRMD